MVKRVLVIGGYGNFGSYLAQSLAGEANIQLIIGGRSREKARKFATQLSATNTPGAVALDISGNMPQYLSEMKPDIVVHTTGPYQHQSYSVAEACIGQGCHYIDLADARRFVVGISNYDRVAREKNILVVSGASSVPCLSAAVIDHYRKYFRSIEKAEYGISAAQQTNRGLATTTAILGYVGKPFMSLIDGCRRTIYGWQDLHTVEYPELGWRLFGNCDIPDLELFPERYTSLKTVRFSAGTEISVLHLGLWLLSWLVRMQLVPSLEKLAPYLLKTANLFDALGTSRSGFHMFLFGIGTDGLPRSEKFYIIAKSGHGPFIPCMPAILLAKGLANGTILEVGARPCLDLIDLDTYRSALNGLDISIVTSAQCD
jgi:hypothetical protein